MAKDTRTDEQVVLEALSGMVASHGDGFRFSISKAGRVWLTLTHWDQAKYNTSVELDGLHEVTDIPGALAVLICLHAGKCFHGTDVRDTWKDTTQTRDLASPALARLRSTGISGLKLGVLDLPSHDDEDSVGPQNAADQG